VVESNSVVVVLGSVAVNSHTKKFICLYDALITYGLRLGLV